MPARGRSIISQMAWVVLLTAVRPLSGQGAVASAERVCWRDSSFVGPVNDRVREIVVTRSDGVWLLDSAGSRVEHVTGSGHSIESIDLKQLVQEPSLTTTRMGYRNGQLWGYDARRRLYFAIRDQHLVRHVRLPETVWKDSVGTALRVVAPWGDNAFLAAPRTISAIEAAGLVKAVPYMEVDSTGSVVHPLLWVPLSPHNMIRVKNPGEAGEVYLEAPLRDSHLVAWAPESDYLIAVDRRVHGHDSASVIVYAIGPAGDTTYFKTVRLATERVDERFLDELADYATGPGSPLAGKLTANQFRSLVWKPEILPPVSNTVVAADGSVWIEQASIDRSKGWDRWIVLSSTLDSAFTARLPSGLNPAGIADGRVWASSHGRVAVLTCTPAH